MSDSALSYAFQQTTRAPRFTTMTFGIFLQPTSNDSHYFQIRLFQPVRIQAPRVLHAQKSLLKHAHEIFRS